MKGRGNTVLGEEGGGQGPSKAWEVWPEEEGDRENLEESNGMRDKPRTQGRRD